MKALLKILKSHEKLWLALRRKCVVVTATRSGEGAFYRASDLKAQAGSLAANGVTAQVLEPLCDQLARTKPVHACVIDMAQAASLVERQRLQPAEAIRRALVRYQGTDGVRGRVAPDRKHEPPLKALVERNEFTPGLCELLCVAFMAQQKARPPQAVVLAEDGRDPRRFMAQAAMRGFSRFGVRVLDLRVAPTPLVPVAAARLGAPYGAVITASHNPADQNGIKFFVHGRKLLPDPDDLAVSAHAFIYALEGLPRAQRKAGVERVDAAPLLSSFFKSAVSAGEIRTLRAAALVVDVAHGAFAPYASDLFEELRVHAEVANESTTGENINRDSGVACLEGKERIAGKDIPAEIGIVGRIRTRAQNGRGPVFGLALDGDGDRGFLLVYDAADDAVRIIDGDRAAYLLARAAGKVKDKVFAGTVESDLAVFGAVEALGIKTVMTPVGDKWLSARPALARKLLVGEESSGHLVWPVKVGRQTVVTGNGLLTGLRAAVAILTLQLSPAEAAEPYKPGVVKTFYTYFVDRPRFHRGGPVWQQDLAIAQSGLEKLQAENRLPAACRLRPVLFKDDPDMLYLNIVEQGRPLGAIFARNSGTENKIATYARGRLEFEAGLVALARAVNQNHVRMLKDERLPEARAGAALAAALAQRKSLPLEEARKIAQSAGVGGEARFFALLFALAKEGSVRRAGDAIEAIV